MESETLSPEEAAIVEGSGSITPVSVMESEAEEITESNGQMVLPEDSLRLDTKIKSLTADVARAYDSAEKRMKAIGEHANFLRKLSEYVCQLDSCDEREVVISNLRNAHNHITDLSESISHALKQLSKAEELEYKLAELASRLADEPVQDVIPASGSATVQLGAVLSAVMDRSVPTDGE